MKVSTRGRFELRMMLDIATNDHGEPVRIKDIAARQDISVKYLEQIVSVLTKAGYVKSIRGPQGGYRLARLPKDYTIGMILRLTEGDLSPVACTDNNYVCPKMQDCDTIRIWKELDDAINGFIDMYTLEDLVDRQDEKGNVYVIEIYTYFFIN